MGKQQKKTQLRVSPKTYNLVMRMKNMERSSADAVILWMWGKLSHQAAEINRWKKATGCSSPDEVYMAIKKDDMQTIARFEGTWDTSTNQ